MALPTLYALGSNGSGQLGLGHDEDVSVPTKCIFEEASNCISGGGVNVKVKRIAAGGNHTLVLLHDGRVYSAGWGESSFRRVAFTEDNGKEMKSFRDVAATWEASILVSSPTSASTAQDGTQSKDKVFVVGTGLKGELGLGFGITSTDTIAKEKNGMQIPNFPPDGIGIISVAAGMSHVMAVCSDGSVYGWGASRKGQLGDNLISEKFIWTPKRIEDVPFKVTSAVCGREFTVLCGDTEQGEILVLGPVDAKKNNTQSGSGNIDKWGIRAGIPDSQQLKWYIDIQASWHDIYVHQTDHSVHAWGRNDRGQIPPLDQLQNMKEIAVGSEHGLALLENGDVVAFGWGEHGNCGEETDDKGDVKGVVKLVRLPESDKGLSVVGVGAGCATSWIIAEP